MELCRVFAVEVEPIAIHKATGVNDKLPWKRSGRAKKKDGRLHAVLIGIFNAQRGFCIEYRLTKYLNLNGK